MSPISYKGAKLKSVNCKPYKSHQLQGETTWDIWISYESIPKRFCFFCGGSIISIDPPPTKSQRKSLRPCYREILSGYFGFDQIGKREAQAICKFPKYAPKNAHRYPEWWFQKCSSFHIWLFSVIIHVSFRCVPAQLTWHWNSLRR